MKVTIDLPGLDCISKSAYKVSNLENLIFRVKNRENLIFRGNQSRFLWQS